MNDEPSLVIPGRCGPKALERVHGPLDSIPPGMSRPVKPVGPTRACASPAVRPLVTAFGNGVPDLPSSRVATVAARAVRLVPAQAVRAGPRVPAGQTRDADAVRDRGQSPGATPLPRCDQQKPARVGGMERPRAA
jgi:hypothetical protein